MTALHVAPDVAEDDGVDYLEPATFFDEKSRIVVSRLAEAIASAGHLRSGTDGRLWQYRGGVFRPDGELFARGQVRVMLGEKYRKAHAEEVVSWLRTFDPSISDEQQTEVLNVANGMLSWRTGELHAHDPTVASTIQIPVAWNPEGFCPAILKFLSDALPEDAVEFVLEVIGYSMLPANPFAKAVLLVGSGGNGKSKLLGVTKAVLGPDNVVALPLQQLSENRFAMSDLYLKLANICGDLDARAVKRSDAFKMLTGGDAVPAERKYGHQFFFTPFALPIFSANEVPISADQSEAWFDRWLVIPMERRFRGTAGDDPHILDKLTTPPELEGLLVEAVAGLRRLMARGRFDVPTSVRQAGERYRTRLDTLHAFVEEECELDADAWVARPALYRAYKGWCEEGGRFALSAASFNERLVTSYPGRVELRTREGGRGWLGLRYVGEADAT